MLAINAYTDDGDTLSRFTAFTQYDIKRKKKIVKIAVNKKFKGLFNDLISSFTRFSLEEFASLKSTYSKTLFRIIKQFRTTGHLEFKIEDFRDLLDIPKGYKQYNIDHRVLTPIRIELPPFFKDFAYTKIKKHTKGRRVIGYKFTWVPESKNKNDFRSWQEHFKDQLENINSNSFIKEKEKDKARQLVNKRFKEQLEKSRVDKKTINKLASGETSSLKMVLPDKGNNKKGDKQNIYNYRFGKNHRQDTKLKENPSKIPYGNETRTSNEKARKALEDFKKKK